MIIQEPGGEYTPNDIKRFRMVARLCRGTVLDIGCGNGELRKYLPKGYANWYTGIDANPTGIAEQGCAYELRFAERSFDTVTLLEVLEHLENPIAALVEARRVMRDRVIISVPNPYNLDQIASVVHNDTNIINTNHVNLFGDNEINNICRNAGFSHIEPVRFYTKIPGLNWLSPVRSRFGEWSIYVVT